MAQTIFITGGASGIGAATAALFIEKGWNAGVLDLHRTEFIDAHPEILFFEGDTRDASGVKKAVDAAAEAFGGLHTVFACAGVHHSDTLLNVEADTLRKIMDINIIGTFNTLRAAVPHIIASGGGAVVINASDQSLIGKPHSFSYGLTKGALGQIAKSMALDLAADNVRVNAICPGTILTPMVSAIFERCSGRGDGTMEDLLAEEAALFPLGRLGTAEEVARLVYFLGTEQSSFCTGGLYPIDGGITAG